MNAAVALTRLASSRACAGSEVAGHSGFFFKGIGVQLNLALINYGIQFLISRGYTPLQVTCPRSCHGTRVPSRSLTYLALLCVCVL